jgi:hypothetical protein
MPGLTRQCRAGEEFRIGEATVRVVKTGRRATINILAPAEIRVEHRGTKHEARMTKEIRSTKELPSHAP